MSEQPNLRENRFRAVVVTVSDKGTAGEREDRSGPAVRDRLLESGYEVVDLRMVPDDRRELAALLRDLCDDPDLALIVTTGGTGLSPRDITPEVTAEVCERLVPGMGEAMRAGSLAITPHGMLSRGIAGIRNRTLILNLPGSPKAARENLVFVLPALRHGLIMLRTDETDHG